MKRTYLLALFLISTIANTALAQDLKAPSDFLGYELGTEFSYYHRVLDYFEYVEKNSDKVSLHQYGETYERRELKVAYISSPENLNNLKDIQENNLHRTDLLEGNVKDDDIAIVWLSYNVHGNEASSTETAMKVLYELVNGENSDYDKWLDKLVIILDPCLNPDGRDRYTYWFKQVANKSPNPNVQSREHYEEWDRGRSNHYLFDLNRDWVWQTQIESVHRLKLYNEWFPQVHVDFHEQGYNSQYFFAPSARPIHEHVTDWQMKFQGIIGKKNAEYFDKKGWLYFTRESYDLLYPGYGDTYPTFNGAIGMTYEMPGGALAGQAVNTNKGDTLTLMDRIDMHYTSSIATLEACYENRKALLDEFETFFNTGNNSDEYYILKSNRKDRLHYLTELLDKNKIKYGSSASTKPMKVYSYDSDNEVSITIDSKDLVIPVNQPKSELVRVLFERNTKLSDSLTYDITAWSLPFVYGLEAFQFTGKLSLSSFKVNKGTEQESIENPYAYLLNWTSLRDAKFLAVLLNNGMKVNYSQKKFEYNNKKYSAGTLIITRIDNDEEKYKKTLLSLAKEHNRELIALRSGASISEMDLGSRKVEFLKKPNVALLAGDGISTSSFGELWYLFEQEIDYPVNILNKDMFNYLDLGNYDVLILASGRYNSMQDEQGFKRLEDWVKKGGKLVLIERAINGFLGEGKFALERNKKENGEEEADDPVLFQYENNSRESLKKYISGGIIKLKIDNTHPLAYGYEDHYYTIKNNNTSYKYLTNGWNVGYITSVNEKKAGFVGSESKDLLNKNVVFGVENRGSGKVIFMADNPIFRAFWQNGKLFIANAIFFDN